MTGKIKVLFICHGNICRSTMAESVMTHFVKEAHLEDRIQVASAATRRDEIGNPPHHGTVGKLKKEGIPLVPHRAIQMTYEDYQEYDYIVGMDTPNIIDMTNIGKGDPNGKIYKLLSFVKYAKDEDIAEFTDRNGKVRDVADPWFTGDFDATFKDVCAGCKGLLNLLKEELRG